MIIALNSLRDFLDPEQLKHLPGNLRIVPCVLLVQNTGGESADNPFRQIIQVFDDNGVHLGTIENPAFIPHRKG